MSKHEVAFYKERIQQITNVKENVHRWLAAANVEIEQYQQSSLIFAGIMGVFIGTYISLV